MARRTGLLMASGLLLGLGIVGRAQIASPPTAPSSAARHDLLEALARPYDFPFAKPTALEKVREHLSRTLKAPVVLDLAALDRRDIHPEDPVTLELKGARLKTGLKLLLDQLGLSYRVVDEDNLLIITDSEGASDPLERIWSELRSLHRDLHDVQDAVDDLLDARGDEGEPRLHKPTIIEEMPGDQPSGAAKSAPRAKPNTNPDAPAIGDDPRPATPRIPLSGRRRVISRS